MHIIYDYIATATIFVLIFTFSAASLLNIVQTPALHISEQQLSTRGETVLGGILGYVGDPRDWGSNVSLRPDGLMVLGLSKNLKSDVVYDLDMDKLARILPIDTGASINESTLYRLLNLGNDYRFSLRLTPILNISIKPIGYVQIYAARFLVTVTTHEMTPVGNINLSAYILTAYYDGGKVYYITNETKHAMTKWNGSASFDYEVFITQLLAQPGRTLVGSILVVIGDFYGMQTMAIYQCSDTATPVTGGIVIGNYMVYPDGGNAAIPAGSINPPPAWDSAECTFNYVIVTKVVNSTIQGSCPWIVNHDGRHYQILRLTYIEPDIYCVVFVVGATGNLGLVVCPRIPSNVQVGAGIIPRGTHVVGLRRIVFIEKMAFIADFYFWRTSH
jgi:hypothetical protein